MNTKDRVPTFDQTKAKLIAYAFVAVLIGVMLVVGMRSSGGPQLWDGDVVESMDCQSCQGSGEVEGERCRGCLGAKKLKVVIPGPNHPAQLKGTVRDLSAFKSEEEGREVAAREAAETGLSLKPVQGGIGQAVLTLEGAEATIALETKATGKYSSLVKPGEYSVTVTAEGFQDQTLTLIVEPREHPIWPRMPGQERAEQDVTTLDVFLDRAP